MGDQNIASVLSRTEWDAVVAGMSLSPRQAEILQCLLRGMSDKQIAGAVGVALPTIRTHLSRLYRKTGTADRLELVLKAMRESRGISSSH